MTQPIKEGNKRAIFFCQSHAKAWDNEDDRCCPVGEQVGWIESAGEEDSDDN